MLDIDFIRIHADAVRRAIADKRIDLDLDRFLSLDEERRGLITERDLLLARRNQLSVDEAKSVGPGIKAELSTLEPKLLSVEREFEELLLRIPQIPSSEAPVGDESANRVIRTEGTVPAFDFESKSHVELGTELDLLDLEAGTKVGGFRGYFLKNEAVLLHTGLMQLALATMRTHGFTLMVPPTIVREHALAGSGHFPFGRGEIYQIGNAARLETENEKEPRYLVGTAEPSLLAYAADTTYNQASLPLKLCGISQCYRSEAGSYGKDSKGLYRVHEFMKVEQVIIAEADEAKQQQYFDEMLAIAEEILKSLELPYRVLDIATGDMGAGKVRMHDIETWMPSRSAYGETHSNSMLGDWQARRLGIKYRTSDGQKLHAFTLNNTVVASPRLLIALLENHQQADGSIRIPQPLQQFVGTEYIRPRT